MLHIRHGQKWRIRTTGEVVEIGVDGPPGCCLIKRENGEVENWPPYQVPTECELVEDTPINQSPCTEIKNVSWWKRIFN